jgi:hypothetical protein
MHRPKRSHANWNQRFEKAERVPPGLKLTNQFIGRATGEAEKIRIVSRNWALSHAIPHADR